MGVAAGLGFVEGMLHILPVPNRFTMIQLFEGMWEPDPELLLRLKSNLDMNIYGHPEFSFQAQTNKR